ncbi:IS3 family transposase [Metabacillus idriensis]|uniref:IS3 family transposase n=1 Tax=Metabacillus idriensis TaxID=324768 RepID=UPI00399000F5
MAKFTEQEKVNAVKRYLNGTEGHKAIAISIGVAHGVFHRWIQQYQYNGEKAFKKRYTTYSLDDKLKVLTYMNEHGTSLSETAAIFKIQFPSTITQWKRLFDTQGVDGLIPREEGRSSYGAYLYKKVECLSSKQNTKQDKAKVVYELRQEFPVKSLLKLAGIPRSTYYHLTKQLELKTAIKEIFHEHKGRYGYRRIRAELANRGLHVNHKKVYRLMRELGLKCLVRIKKYRSYKGEAGKVAENVLNRNFKASKPNEKWVTDITEFKLFGEKLYFSPMLDLYNGEILTYTIGSRPTYSLVSSMLNKALRKKRKEDTLLIHSDQGWHYQMKKYSLALKKKDIIQSMSRKGNCYDNAVIENFFGILKSEFLNYQDFKNVEHFKEELRKYIHYYNHKMIKTKLKGKSPVQYRTLAHQVA